MPDDLLIGSASLDGQFLAARHGDDLVLLNTSSGLEVERLGGAAAVRGTNGGRFDKPEWMSLDNSFIGYVAHCFISIEHFSSLHFCKRLCDALPHFKQSEGCWDNARPSPGGRHLAFSCFEYERFRSGKTTRLGFTDMDAGEKSPWQAGHLSIA